MGREEVAPMRWYLLILCLFAGFSTATRAQASDWISSVFPDRTHNFGNVARGSKVRHSFPVVNRSNSEVHIASWRPKCGCTDVKVGARIIPPGTQTTIEATIDTTKFQERKDSGLTLIIDRPTYVEVELNLTCFIRGDVTLNPGQFDFGTVRRSEKLPSAVLTLTYNGGRTNWEIAEMKTQSAKVKAVAQRLNQSAGGLVQWTITATLQQGITNGYFKDEITLITNDTPAQTIPISVVANVQSAVSVTPSIINFGPIRAGQSVTKAVHVRSSGPFSLTKLDGNRPELRADEPQPGSLPTHTVNVTILAPASPGPFYGIVTIESDLKDEPAGQIKTFATVVPAS
jgi:Protein of unknown function (DUF1573)